MHLRRVPTGIIKTLKSEVDGVSGRNDIKCKLDIGIADSYTATI